MACFQAPAAKPYLLTHFRLEDQQSIHVGKRWPHDRQLSLLALTDTPDSPGWRDRVDGDPTVAHYWDIGLEYVSSGPVVDPPFHGAVMIDLTDARNANTLTEDLVRAVGPEHALVYACAPAASLWMLTAFGIFMRRLPAPNVGLLPPS